MPLKTANSSVAWAARELPKYKGTTITSEFISSRSKSWQCHLQRIAHYLLPGKGVWWEDTHNGYWFFDGSDDPISHPEGPVLRHFRSTTLKDVSESTQQIWNVVLEKKLDLPTTRLQLYDTNGLPLSELPQDENTRATDTTSELLNDGEMETNDESRGSGDSLNENTGHIMEANLEDNMELNQDEGSAQEEVQVANVDDSISTASAKADICYKTKHANEIASFRL